MARNAIGGLAAVGFGVGDVAGHPWWCARAHHCTADSLPTGEHASVPEVWATSLGRVAATRYRDRGGVQRMELRVVLALDPGELVAQAQCRHLIATTCLVVQRVFAKAGTVGEGPRR